MAAPTFVNNGARSDGISISPALPGSRSNGNLLLAVYASRGNGTITCSTAGWRKFGQVTIGTASTGTLLALFTYIVDGNETAPALTGGAGTPAGQVFQYSGVDPLNPPIGAYLASSGTVTPHTNAGITTTRNDSLAVYIDANKGAALATPGGWTEDADSNNGSAGIAIGHMTVATSGTSTGAISVAGANSQWGMFVIEIQSPGAAVSTFYVDKGAANSSTGVPTTVTPSLPSSLTNGDLLIAVCVVRGTTNGTINCATTGWSQYDQQTQGSGATGLRTAIFRRYVDGTETAPVFTWSSGTNCFAQVYQYRGVDQSSPFGASNINSGTTSPHSVNAITTTQANSCVIYIDANRPSGTSPPIVDRPAGWREDVQNLVVASECVVGSKGISSSGSSSGNISVPVNPDSLSWIMWQIELLPPSTAVTQPFVFVIC